MQQNEHMNNSHLDWLRSIAKRSREDFY